MKFLQGQKFTDYVRIPSLFNPFSASPKTGQVQKFLENL